jgi:hypothetical protein
MELKYHGPSYEEKGRTAWFYLGILRLLHVLVSTFRSPLFPGQKRPEWPTKWLDPWFENATMQFQATFWKFDKAASCFGQCVEVVKHDRDSLQAHDVAKLNGAIGDIPLYLDSMLFYFRIQADCLAAVIPNFYGQRGRMIARRSFREHGKCFMDKRPDFDPKYAEILRTYQGWFKTLAGKGESEGLRDAITHRFGRYQLGWNVGDKSDEFEFRASLIGDAGFVCENLVPTLKSMMADYYFYLDRIYMYFTERLRAELGDEVIPAGDKLAQYARFTWEEGSSFPSFWIYPTLTSHSSFT